MTARKPSKAETEAALAKSAETLAEPVVPPEEIHVKPTTPSQAEVEAAVEQSAEHLEAQGVNVTAPESRDKLLDAAPVSAGGTNPGLDAAPVSAARDKTADASPVFSEPLRDAPKE